jgi:hypothetical protein
MVNGRGSRRIVDPHAWLFFDLLSDAEGFGVGSGVNGNVVLTILERDKVFTEM